MTVSSQISIRGLAAVLALIAAAFSSQQTLAATQCVNASAPAPLEICVQDDATPSVWVTSALQAQGYNVTASVGDRRTVWRLHVGWSSHRHLALEVGSTHITSWLFLRLIAFRSHAVSASILDVPSLSGYIDAAMSQTSQ